MQFLEQVMKQLQPTNSCVFKNTQNQVLTFPTSYVCKQITGKGSFWGYKALTWKGQLKNKIKVIKLSSWAENKYQRQDICTEKSVDYILWWHLENK